MSYAYGVDITRLHTRFRFRSAAGGLGVLERPKGGLSQEDDDTGWRETVDTGSRLRDNGLPVYDQTVRRASSQNGQSEEGNMHASAYLCIHAGLDLSVDTTDPTDVAVLLQELGELMPKAVIRSWCFGEFKLTGPWWYRVSNLETRGPLIGLWLVGQLCARGWDVFQVNQGDTTHYHLRRSA